MDWAKLCDLAANGVIETIHYRFHNSHFLTLLTSTVATMQRGLGLGGKKECVGALFPHLFSSLSTARFYTANRFLTPTPYTVQESIADFLSFSSLSVRWKSVLIKHPETLLPHITMSPLMDCTKPWISTIAGDRVYISVYKGAQDEKHHQLW